MATSSKEEPMNAPVNELASRLPSKEPAGRRRSRIIALLLLLVPALWYLRPNPEVERVRQMQRELFAAAPNTITPEERKVRMEALRAAQEKLSTSDRALLRKEMGQ